MQSSRPSAHRRMTFAEYARLGARNRGRQVRRRPPQPPPAAAAAHHAAPPGSAAAPDAPRTLSAADADAAPVAAGRARPRRETAAAGKLDAPAIGPGRGGDDENDGGGGKPGVAAAVQPSSQIEDPKASASLSGEKLPPRASAPRDNAAAETTCAAKAGGELTGSETTSGSKHLTTDTVNPARGTGSTSDPQAAPPQEPSPRMSRPAETSEARQSSPQASGDLPQELAVQPENTLPKSTPEAPSEVAQNATLEAHANLAPPVAGDGVPGLSIEESRGAPHPNSNQDGSTSSPEELCTVSSATSREPTVSGKLADAISHADALVGEVEARVRASAHKIRGSGSQQQSALVQTAQDGEPPMQDEPQLDPQDKDGKSRGSTGFDVALASDILDALGAPATHSAVDYQNVPSALIEGSPLGGCSGPTASVEIPGVPGVEDSVAHKAEKPQLASNVSDPGASVGPLQSNLDAVDIGSTPASSQGNTAKTAARTKLRQKRPAPETSAKSAKRRATGATTRSARSSKPPAGDTTTAKDASKPKRASGPRKPRAPGKTSKKSSEGDRTNARRKKVEDALNQTLNALDIDAILGRNLDDYERNADYHARLARHRLRFEEERAMRNEERALQHAARRVSASQPREPATDDNE